MTKERERRWLKWARKNIPCAVVIDISDSGITIPARVLEILTLKKKRMGRLPRMEAA